MSTAQRLHILTGVALGALGIVATAGVGSALALRWRVGALLGNAVPARVELTALDGGLAGTAAHLARLPGVHDQAALAALSQEINGGLDRLDQGLQRLAGLGAGLAPGDLAPLRAAAVSCTGLIAQALASRAVADQAHGQAAAGLQATRQAADTLATGMLAIQGQAQDSLTAAKTTALASNAEIKTALALREQIALARLLVGQAVAIGSRYRLNSLRDRVEAAAGAITGAHLRDQALASELRSAATSFQAGFLGDDGLLAAQAAVLAEAADEERRKRRDALASGLLKGLEATALRVAETVDGLEPAVQQANSAMDAAARLIPPVGAVVAQAQRLAAAVQTLETLAWRLRAGEAATLPALAAGCERSLGEAEAAVAALLAGLDGLGRQDERKAVENAGRILGETRSRLLGPGGALPSTRAALDAQAAAQAAAEAAGRGAADTCRRIAGLAESQRGVQEAQAAAVLAWSAAAVALIAAVALVAAVVSLRTARRVRHDILSGEDTAQAMASRLASVVQQIADSSGELRSVAQSLLGHSAELSERSQGAAGLAAGTKDLSTRVLDSVDGVAALAQGIASGVAGVAASAADASRVGSEARGIAEQASQAVDRLGAASADIDKVVRLITRIAEQTNLLALNAGIEAARAGDAGRGFLVVANEIKELARQTAQATRDITARIRAIQEGTSASCASIGEVAGIIGRIGGMQERIRSEVAAQGEAARSISGGLARAAEDCRGIDGNAAGTSSAASAAVAAVAEVRSLADRLAALSGALESTARKARQEAGA